MQRISTSTAVATRPTAQEDGAPGYFTDGDALTGLPGTRIGQVFFNGLQETLAHPVENSGQILDVSDDTQLTAAIRFLGQVSVFDSVLSQKVGGYPQGAIVSDPGNVGVFWQSTANANTTTPGSSGTLWRNLFDGLISGVAAVNAAGGDKKGLTLNYNASSTNASFGYDGGGFDLAKYQSYIGAPTLYGASTSIAILEGVTRAFVKIIGGGGSGCSCKGTGTSTSTYGAGGASGGYLYFWITIKENDVLKIDVGAGGSSPTQTVTGQVNGGDTVVYLNGTEVARAYGGTGGVWNSVSSSAGGTGGGASTLNGATPIEYSNGTDGADGQTGANSDRSISGHGGPGPWGGGGRAGNGGGSPGSGFGAGGGGAYDTSYSGNFCQGGAGHNGCATVEFR